MDGVTESKSTFKHLGGSANGHVLSSEYPTQAFLSQAVGPLEIKSLEGTLRLEPEILEQLLATLEGLKTKPPLVYNEVKVPPLEQPRILNQVNVPELPYPEIKIEVPAPVVYIDPVQVRVEQPIEVKNELKTLISDQQTRVFMTLVLLVLTVQTVLGALFFFQF